MEAVLLTGLTAGTLVVLFCSAQVTRPLRQTPYLRKLLDCTFCTSFWVSLVVDPSYTILATVAVANITVYAIELSLGSYYESSTQENLQGSGTEGDDSGE